MSKNENGQSRIFYKILQILMKIPVLQNIRMMFFFYDSVVAKFIKKPEKDSSKKRVLVVFPFALGDCILFLGAIENMQKIYPSGEYIRTIACQKGYEELFTQYFDKVIPVEYTKASVNPLGRIRMIKKIRSMYFDIILDPIGCEECSPNVFSTYAACGDMKIGVLENSDKKVQCPKWMRKKIYDQVLEIPDKNLHKIKFYARVWEMLGVEKPVAHPAVLNRIEIKQQLPEKYFVVFPSASLPVKQWPIGRFAEITRRIYKKTGWMLVVCGTKRDAETIEGFLREIPEIPVCNMVQKTNVPEFIEVIGRAAFVLTNDTSAYHIAVAQKRKVCVVTGRYVYNTFIDYGEMNENYQRPIIACRKGKCCNCNNRCIFKVTDIYPCVLENTVEDVWRAVEKGLIEKEVG